MHLADRVRNGRRRNRPSDAPSRDAVALREPVDGDRALAHPVEARERDMFRSIVKNVLVDFVGDGEHVVLNAHVTNQFQFFPAEHLAGRVVWRVNDDGFGLVLTGLVLKSLAQFLFVERPLSSPSLWWTQTD